MDFDSLPWNSPTISVNKTGLSILELRYAQGWTWRNAKMAVKRIYFVRFAKQTDCSHAMWISSHCCQQASLSLCSCTPQYMHKNSPSDILTQYTAPCSFSRACTDLRMQMLEVVASKKWTVSHVWNQRSVRFILLKPTDYVTHQQF